MSIYEILVRWGGGQGTPFDNSSTIFSPFTNLKVAFV